MLVAALLSSQTKDEITHRAVQRLRAAGILTLEGILGASQDEVQRLIYPVSLLMNALTASLRLLGKGQSRDCYLPWRSSGRKELRPALLSLEL